MTSQFEIWAATNDLFKGANVAVNNKPTNQRSLFDLDSDDEAPSDSGFEHRAPAAFTSLEDVGESLCKLCPASAGVAGASLLQQFPGIHPSGVEAETPLSAMGALKISICIETVLEDYHKAKQRALLAEVTGDSQRGCSPSRSGDKQPYKPPLFLCCPLNYMGVVSEKNSTALYRSPRTNVVQPLVPLSAVEGDINDFDAVHAAVMAVDDSLVKRHLAEDRGSSRRLEQLCNAQCANFAEAYYTNAVSGTSIDSEGNVPTLTVSTALVKDRTTETQNLGGGGSSPGGPSTSNASPSPPRGGSHSVLEIAIYFVRHVGDSKHWISGHSFLVEMARESVRLTQRSKVMVSLPDVSGSARPLSTKMVCEFNQNMTTNLTGLAMAGSPLGKRPSADTLSNLSFTGVSEADSTQSNIDITSSNSLRHVVEVVGTMLQTTENSQFLPSLTDVMPEPCAHTLQTLVVPHKDIDEDDEGNEIKKQPVTNVSPGRAHAEKVKGKSENEIESQRAQRNAEAAKALAELVKMKKRAGVAHTGDISSPMLEQTGTFSSLGLE